MYDDDPCGDVPEVAGIEVYNLLQKDEISVLDVRDPVEWQLGHIEGAHWIPLSALPRRWRELDPERKFAVVCLSGVRSMYAAALLRQVGLNTVNLEGGMLNWDAAGLPITPPGIVAGH